MKQEIRSCYITAPAGAKIEALKRVLENHDIEIVTPTFDLGSAWQAQINEALRRADLVIGVLTSERRSQWVLFELGIAAGLNKRSLLIAPAKTEVPSDLLGIQIVRASLDNIQALDFAISQLKQVPQTKAISASAPSTPQIVQPDVNRLLADLDAVSHIGSERELEELVAALLKDSGVEYMREASKVIDQNLVDFAIWSDAFQPSVGNPLLIEVKREFPDKRFARDVIQEFSKTVAAAGSYWGLFLYAIEPKKPVTQSLPPNVLLISIRELLRNMQQKPFVSVVRDLRNARVHGGHS